MSKLVLFCFALCTGTLAWGQTLIEIAEQRTDRVDLIEMLPYPGGKWLTWERNDAGQSIMVNRYQLTLRDSMGDAIWSHGTDMPRAFGTPEEPDLPYHIGVLPDGRIVIAGCDDQCDYYSHSERVVCLNPDGSESWSRVYPLEESYPQEPELIVAVNDQGSIALASSDSLKIFDSDGSLISTCLLSGEELYSLVWADSVSLYYSTQDQIYQVTGSGSVISQGALLTSGTQSQILVQNDSVYVLQSNGLTLFDSALNILAQNPFLNLPSGNVRLIHGPGVPWIVTATSVQAISPSLNLVSVMSLNPLPEQAGFFHAHFVDDALMTGFRVAPFGYPSAVFKNYRLDGSNLTTANDVSIDMAVDSVWAQFIGMQNGAFLEYDFNARISYTVTNESLDTLRSVLVTTSEFLWVAFCDEPSEIDTIFTNLPPGGTVSGNFESIREYNLVFYPDPTGGAPPQEVICVTALNPNGKVDMFPADNQACQTVVWQWPIAVNELSAKDLSIYPIPFYNELLVRLPFGSDKCLMVDFYDSTGRKLLCPFSILRDDQIRIDTSELLQGVYVLSVVTANGKFDRKVVKDQK